jgi:hypothetical protein
MASGKSPGAATAVNVRAEVKLRSPETQPRKFFIFLTLSYEQGSLGQHEALAIQPWHTGSTTSKCLCYKLTNGDSIISRAKKSRYSVDSMRTADERRAAVGRARRSPPKERRSTASTQRQLIRGLFQFCQPDAFLVAAGLDAFAEFFAEGTSVLDGFQLDKRGGDVVRGDHDIAQGEHAHEERLN